MQPADVWDYALFKSSLLVFIILSFQASICLFSRIVVKDICRSPYFLDELIL
jgi:hypothetical protein